MAEEKQEAFDGLDGEDKTALGFGGKTIHRHLHLGDELYLLLKVEISSETMKEDKDGNLHYAAGARTHILAELDQGTAAQVAADHG